MRGEVARGVPGLEASRVPQVVERMRERVREREREKRENHFGSRLKSAALRL